jgi:hypothetical protein
MKNIKEEILHQLEKPINDITARIIESEKKEYLKKIGKELNVTPWMEKMIRLSLVIDLMKALQNYVLPTDELEEMDWCEGPKGLEIHSSINRNGEKHYFLTEAITAGGYNIQRLHYRYLTKTKMPRVASDLASEYVAEQKRMKAIERLEKELDYLNKQYKEKETLVNTYSAMNREELIEAMKKSMYSWRYEAWKRDGDNDVLEEGIKSLKQWNIEWPKRYMKNILKKIAKLNIKIETLK